MIAEMSIFREFYYFLSFEAGSCIINSSLERMKNLNKQFSSTRVKIQDKMKNTRITGYIRLYIINVNDENVIFSIICLFLILIKTPETGCLFKSSI